MSRTNHYGSFFCGFKTCGANCCSCLCNQQVTKIVHLQMRFPIVFADALSNLKVNHLAALSQCRISAMSAALQGASDRDFEDHAMWLADTIKWYLSPRSAVRFLRRVVEIIESQPDYAETQDMCGGFCAYSTCNLVCAN